MNGRTSSGGAARAAVLIAVATLVALALPATSPLYAQIYPQLDAKLNDALTTATLETGFSPEQVTQFEKVRFDATIIYGTSATPGLPTVKVAWSNEAVLSSQADGAFVIVPTSASRQFLDQGTRRPGGGYALTWTWEVIPLVAGEQTLVLSILPTVVVEGKKVPDVVDVNKPIKVTVDVNPAQRDFDEVLVAAADMETTLPAQMTVGEEYDVSAAMSMAGHAETVAADIALAAGEDSAEVTITEATAASRALQQVALTGSDDSDQLVRRWTVIPDAPGQVDLVFTANVTGHAAEQELSEQVPITATARAVEPGASFWDNLQKPVLYLTPFVALLATLLGLRATWLKRQQEKAPAAEPAGGARPGPTGPGDPAR